MKIVFAGTPDFSVPSLQVLLDSPHDVVAVYTQPDRPAGRGRQTVASPVKQLAMQHDVPVCQPDTLKTGAAQQQLAEWQPQLMIVVAYGLLLPAAVLVIPGLGCVNVHASLLPRWRGAAPIQRAILAGDTETGVCLMQMDAGLDTGPVLACSRCEIAANDTGKRLHDKLSLLGAHLLSRNLAALEKGELEAHPQDESLASYAGKLQKSEARIDWNASATDIANKIRAFNSWPVAETRYQGRQLRIWEAYPLPVDSDTVPGTVLSASRAGIEVACGQGRLCINKVQLPGARVIDAVDFINVHALDGMLLGS
ncbi:MAG: methionyl-tRNA formyltransferase [Gammaproteobacteria bacterium]|jgi:methionyl-tRNA formyltransferase